MVRWRIYASLGLNLVVCVLARCTRMFHYGHIECLYPLSRVIRTVFHQRSSQSCYDQPPLSTQQLSARKESFSHLNVSWTFIVINPASVGFSFCYSFQLFIPNSFTSVPWYTGSTMWQCEKYLARRLEYLGDSWNITTSHCQRHVGRLIRKSKDYVVVKQIKSIPSM